MSTRYLYITTVPFKNRIMYSTHTHMSHHTMWVDDGYVWQGVTRRSFRSGVSSMPADSRISRQSLAQIHNTAQKACRY